MGSVWHWTSRDGSIQKRIVKKGIRGQRPNVGSPCRFIVNNEEEKDLTIGNADTCLMITFESVLLTMTCGEIVEVMSKDFSGLMSLIQFERSKETFEMTVEERYKRAESCKELGVRFFNEGHVEAALRQFVRAAQLLVFLGRRSEENQGLFLAVTSNLSQVHLSLGRLDDAVSAASKVLEIRSDDVKCLLRRASAYQRLRDFDKSRDDFVRALELEPANPVALKALPVVKQEIACMNERYGSMVKRMFQ